MDKYLKVTKIQCLDFLAVVLLNIGETKRFRPALFLTGTEEPLEGMFSLLVEVTYKKKSIVYNTLEENNNIYLLFRYIFNM